jgi:uncharacterized C2H2 Zn-finger protein
MAINNQNYTCDECHRSFTSAHGLFQHCRDTKHASKVACPKCGKQFHSVQAANQHLNSPFHQKPHTAKQSKGLTCEFCQKRFHYRSDRLRHLKNAHDIALNPKPKPGNEKRSEFLTELALKLKNRKPVITRKKHFPTAIYAPKCPPHEFMVMEHAYVGFGPGNANETLHEDGIERCVHCYRTRARIELDENNKY